ncbi:MAG: hypothetical protein QOK37_10 [Thermoanaerobaculia bacterium]|jgi:hypothetical protein|nr:hypothetical protein [Thermoanaerobaculia bacterium]
MNDMVRVPLKARLLNLSAASLVFAFAFAALPAAAGESPKSVAADLEALTARVAKLEGQIVSADLVGTYALNGFQNELNANNQGRPSVSSYVYGGTLTLAADGTASLSTPQNGNVLFLGTQPSRQAVQSNDPPFLSTWSYANGNVTVQGLPFALSVAAGGRVMIAATANHSDGTDVLVILTRLQ